MTRPHGAWLAAVTLLLVLLLGIVVLLPPRQVAVGPLAGDRRTVRGSVHVHTVRSDGAGTVDDVARAAHEAGLDFVVLTDHGDGTRVPDAPAYRHGVLCLDAVEISTTGGHYIAIGLPGAAPYRLGGEPEDVVEDVARLGGFGVVAHPASPKPELAWRAWDVPFDGFEWLNADSEWRDESRAALARVLLTYWWRPREALASIFDRPSTLLARWDELTLRRRVVALAGHDAHARIGAPKEDGAQNGRAVMSLPSYRVAFESFAVRAHLDAPMTGVASEDAVRLVTALRQGHTFTAVDAFASPAPFTFEARAGTRTVEAGDALPGAVDVELTARAVDLPGLSLWLIRNGQVVASGAGTSLVYRHRAGSEATVYRVEAWLERHGRIPWIVGNPIYVGLPQQDRQETATEKGTPEPLTGAWRVEREPHCAVSLTPVPGQRGAGASVAVHLAEGVASAYGAAVLAVRPGAIDDGAVVQFDMRATAPARVSVQVRTPPAGERWIKSVYVDPSVREFAVPVRTMVPVGPVGRPPAGKIDSLLFVIDTVHTVPGQSVHFEVRDVAVSTWDGASAP